MIFQKLLRFNMQGRGMLNIGKAVSEELAASGVQTGLANLFLHHTSASLILCENADPAVQQDLESFIQNLVKDGDPVYRHTEEGPDDMSAHIRSILTQNSLTVPVTGGRLALGTWQGIYLWEHRFQSFERKLTVTISGE